MIKGKDFYLSVGGKEVAKGEILFDKLGKYKFYCPSEEYSGVITVLPRKGEVVEKKKDNSREIASEKKSNQIREERSLVKIWMPKENP